MMKITEKFDPPWKCGLLPFVAIVCREYTTINVLEINARKTIKRFDAIERIEFTI